jgi:hypothetical protein
MASIAKTMFSQRVTNAQHDDLANITGLFVDGNGDAEVCAAGFLCTRSEQLDSDAYAGVKNDNAWEMIAATDSIDASTPVYACNSYNVNEIYDAVHGNVYKVGHSTLGLEVPAGERGTFTKIDFLSGDKIYRFGEGNMSTTVSTNTFFTIAAGLLVPGASAPATAGAIYFELIGTGTAIEGTYASMTYYDLMAKVVLA